MKTQANKVIGFSVVACFIIAVMILVIAYTSTLPKTEIEYKFETPCVLSYNSTKLDLGEVVDLATFVPKKRSEQFFSFNFDDGKVQIYPVTNIHITAMMALHKTCRQMALSK